MTTIDTQGIWISKKIYDDAEINHYERLGKASLTPLAGEVAKARQRLIETRDTFNQEINEVASIDPELIKFMEKKLVEFSNTMGQVMQKLNQLDLRLSAIEKRSSSVGEAKSQKVDETTTTATTTNDEEDDEIDLFGSESEGEDEAAEKIKEERLAAYNAKKSKKPVLIAKSNVIFDIKPWDDETDMKKMEEEVRKIETDGLLWGAGKLVPLAYGIHKLQLSCVIEDDKVSTDWLEEQITALEDYVQSIDIAAFNKI